MTVEQLSGSKLLITLGKKDMEDFRLSFDSMSIKSEHERKIVMRLLQLASVKSGVSISGKTVLVEALPHVGGCALFVTLLEKEKGRKTYKVKRLPKFPGVRFHNAEGLLSAAQHMSENLSIHSNSLWLYEGEYYLIMDYPYLPRAVSSLLCQYGEILELSGVFLSRIREGGKVLKKGNAMDFIRKSIQQ